MRLVLRGMARADQTPCRVKDEEGVKPTYHGRRGAAAKSARQCRAPTTGLRDRGGFGCYDGLGLAPAEDAQDLGDLAGVVNGVLDDAGEEGFVGVGAAGYLFGEIFEREIADVVFQ